MTDQEINTAIAEACGWKFVRMVHLRAILEDGLCGHPPACNYDAGIPDYCNDLNAMHGACIAELKTEDKRGNMLDELCKIVRRDHNRDDGPMTAVIQAFYATARQRAEAFLRTLGKWVE